MIECEDTFSLWIEYFSAPPISVHFTLWSAEQMELKLNGESVILFLACKRGVSCHYLWVTWCGNKGNLLEEKDCKENPKRVTIIIW